MMDPDTSETCRIDEIYYEQVVHQVDFSLHDRIKMYCQQNIKHTQN